MEGADPVVETGQQPFVSHKSVHPAAEIIHRGVDLSLFTPREQATPAAKKKKIIGIVGRLTPLKGHAHFIRSLPEIFSEYSSAEAWIIGDAPAHKRHYADELKSLVAKLGIAEKVKFLGAVSDVPAKLRQIDVLVMSTTTEEAFGRVIIEAGAVGVPVVATRVGGVVEIVTHEQTGLLVEPGDPHAIAKAVLRFFHDPELTESCVRRLRERVRDDFSLEAMVNKTITVYEEALLTKRILVVKLGAFGDVILAGPSLRALREAYPRATIDVLVRAAFKGVLQNCPYINGIVLLRNGSLKEFFSRVSLLRRRRYDTLIDLQNNYLSHALGVIAGIPQRFGYRNKKLGFLLNRGIPDRNKQSDPVTHQGYVLNAVRAPIRSSRLELWISER